MPCTAILALHEEGGQSGTEEHAREYNLPTVVKLAGSNVFDIPDHTSCQMSRKLLSMILSR